MILSAGPSGSNKPCKPRASGDDPMYVNDAIGFRM
mgnify:CR=1 FL=1